MKKFVHSSSIAYVLLVLFSYLFPSVSQAVEEGDRAPAANILEGPTSFGFEITSLVSVNTALIAIQAEYQPPFIQNYNLGVLGIGLLGSVGDYIIGKTNLGFGLGVQARYQFRYSSTQTIVPMIGYQFEIRSYDTDTGTAISHAVENGRFQSPFAGVWIFLNKIDPSAARDLYEEIGVSRTYITAELRNNFSSDPRLTFDNYDFYIGLRFER